MAPRKYSVDPTGALLNRGDLYFHLPRCLPQLPGYRLLKSVGKFADGLVHEYSEVRQHASSGYRTLCGG